MPLLFEIKKVIEQAEKDMLEARSRTLPGLESMSWRFVDNNIKAHAYDKIKVVLNKTY